MSVGDGQISMSIFWNSENGVYTISISFLKYPKNRKLGTLMELRGKKHTITCLGLGWICNKCYKNRWQWQFVAFMLLRFVMHGLVLFIIPTPRPPPSALPLRVNYGDMQSSSNFWVCGLNTMVRLFKWNHFNSTFRWHYFSYLGILPDKI